MLTDDELCCGPHLYIDGKWVPAQGGGSRDIVNPADGTVIATVDEADRADAVAAVAAARTAFDTGGWPQTPVAERIAYLLAIADLLDEHRDHIARLETLDTGKTLRESYIDLHDVVEVFRYYARLAATSGDRLVDTGNPAVISRVVREPVGVCALIAPWNYPLLQMSWKIAPALAAGCTMVVKPSEVTPLTTIALMRLIDRAGVPAGVVNLIQSSGATVGSALTDTPDVDLISFTGGAATGETIARNAAAHITRVALELGGKNPHIIFPDADFESAVDAVLTGAFLHSGQVCSAGTRLILHEDIADNFVAELSWRAAGIRIGPGLDETSETGPLVSEQHRAKVEAYVALGISEGARLVTGGARPEAARLQAGSFYLPTIFDGCHRWMRIVQEETFGPILTVERFSTEAQAIALGNDTAYGLAAGVRTADAARGERLVRALRHGTVWLNDFGYYTPAAEWGGFGRSGIGRELGPSGLAEYQETKHIWHNTAPAVGGWFSDN
ncbi:aldehyde dehydrogenase family protein [Nocardia sp. NPDC020380]|uniref:aldehyde dehydrogenase family protein n=1 Tax=Nocardia sp. NPDC020380 TaxID=3364309 RepID=UPI0037B7A190